MFVSLPPPRSYPYEKIVALTRSTRTGEEDQLSSMVLQRFRTSSAAQCLVRLTLLRSYYY